MKSFHLILFVLFILLFTACNDKKKNSNEVSKYKNITIVTIAPNFDKAITGPIRKEIKEFEDITGAKVRVVSPSWDDMIQKIKSLSVIKK